MLTDYRGSIGDGRNPSRILPQTQGGGVLAVGSWHGVNGQEVPESDRIWRPVYAAKGRIALVGPAGSGKSYTSLLMARALAGPTGKIAAIDTERGSLSKYADVFGRS
jgi:hypothetical protein